MKFPLVLLTVFIFVSQGMAQATTSLTQLGNAGDTAQAADSDTVKVRGRGVGVDEESALKDAYRDAIERAVGLYVDAEQVAKNNELVKDQILTQSNAYITDYQQLGVERFDGGLVQIRILATVKKQALTKKISDAMPAQTFSLGDDAQNLHAETTTVAKRGEDGATLLQNVLSGVDPVRQLVRFSLADAKLIRKKWGDKGERCMYRFKFEIDAEKYYNEFLPPLLKVLDQIAIEQPQDFRLSRCDDEQHHRTQIDDLAEGIAYLGGVFETYDGQHIHGPREMNGDELEKIKQDLDLRMTSQTRKTGYVPYYLNMGDADEAGIYCDISTLSNYGKKPWMLPLSSTDLADYSFKNKKDAILKNGFFQITVIVKMNKEMTSITARRYKLPVDCFPVVWKWYASIAAWDKRTNYLIEFSDGAGEEVATFPVQIKNKLLLNVFLGGNRGDNSTSIFPDYSKDRFSDAPGMYVTPMILTAAQSFQTWIPFDIPQDQLSQIRSVKISLEDNGVSNANVPVTKKNGEECAALLKQALDGVDPVKQLLNLSLAEPKLLRKEWGDKGERCLYRFKFEVDETKYYNAFLPSLLKVLDQIAIAQPKTIHLRRTGDVGGTGDWSWRPKRMSEQGIAYFSGDFRVYGDGRIDHQGLLSNGRKLMEDKWVPLVGFIPYVMCNEYKQHGVYCDVGMLGTGNGTMYPWLPDHHLNRTLDNVNGALDYIKNFGFFQITVITKMNKAQTIVTAKCYKLPPECLDVIVEWFKRVGNNNRNFVQTNYVISFLDDDGGEVAAYPVSFKNSALINVFVGSDNPSSSIFQDYPADNECYGMYVTPMVHTIAQSFQTWIPFDIPQDQLPKIRSVKIELTD